MVAVAARVLDPGQDGPGGAAVEGVAGAEAQPAVDGVVVGHGEVFGGRVGGVEGPEVDDLAAMGVCDSEGLAFGDEEGGAAAGGEGFWEGHVFWGWGVGGMGRVEGMSGTT